MIDVILTNTVLPDVSREFLNRMIEGMPITGVNIGLKVGISNTALLEGEGLYGSIACRQETLMALKIVKGCNQSVFNSRTGGSCWGIAFLFCKYALAKGGAVAGADALLSDEDAPSEVERLMKVQEGIHAKAAPLYKHDDKNVPISDLGTPEGFSNQNLNIQLRHNTIKDLGGKNGMRCIGTLSSFFEGGTPGLVGSLVELGGKAGFAAVQMSLQQPKGHAVALFLVESDPLYYFDPNKGLLVATNKSTEVSDVGSELNGYTFSIGHVFLKS